MRRFERLGDLPRDRQRFVERDRARRDPLGERRPFDQLQHERACVRRRFLDAVDGAMFG